MGGVIPMNILLQELKMTYRTLIAYTISMIAIFCFFLVFFESFSKDTAVLEKLLSNFPKEFKAALGLSDVNMSELIGYLSFLFNYLVLIGSIFSLKLSISALSEEIRTKTADFLFSKPVTRTQLFISKLLAVICNITIQNLIIFPAFYLIIFIFLPDQDLNFKIFTLMCLSIFLVQLFFIGIGFIVAVSFKKIRSVMPMTLGIVFLYFILEFINQSISDKKLALLTPFAYFKGSDIIKLSAFQGKYIACVLLVFILGSLISLFIYHKKDIPSVS